MRKRPVSAGQRAASAVILVLLAAVAIAVAIKGRDYDPEQETIDIAGIGVSEGEAPGPMPAVPVSALETPRRDARASAEIPRLAASPSARTMGLPPAGAVAGIPPEGGTPKQLSTATLSARRASTATLVIARLVTPTTPSLRLSGAAFFKRPLSVVSTSSTLSTASTSSTLSIAPVVPSPDLVFHVAGLTPIGLTEQYPAERLYEKIDGQDTSYLSFGVRRLRFITLALANNPTRTIDVYDYEMAAPEGAAGIFARERDPQGTPLAYAAAGLGYRSGPALFFTSGRHYWQLIAIDGEPPLPALCEALAREILK